MLRVHEVAVRLVREVLPLVEEIQRVDPDLARQLRRAVMSAPLNVAEGSEQTGKRRNLHYRIALGSAREAWSALQVADAARYISPPTKELRNSFDQIIGTLHRCIVKRS
jgi:four helix bundle protein